jgi:class 3 adenylate cyclase
VKRHLRKQERILSDQIHAAKLRGDNLLYDIFPYTVAEELITSGAVKPRGCDNVAVLFCDVVGFTPFCNDHPPDEVVARLHELFTAYEDAVRQCRVEKIKTIGDCMMITAGLMQRFDNPVMNCLRCAEMMIAAARRCSAGWEVRVGIHVGPVVAGMAGNKQYAFDVWGDTVNTASRIERTAAPGSISVSEPAWARVYHACRGTSLGIQPLKGKDSMEVFRFEGFREEEE